MAIKNIHGHGVSSKAPTHHQQVTAADIKFSDSAPGLNAPPAAKKKGSKFPPAK